MVLRLLHGSEGGERRSGTSRRFFLLAYHFPPATTAGALRWQKLLPLLAERDCRFDVLTLAPIPNPDWDRLKELPDDTRVYGVAPGRSWMDRLDGARQRGASQREKADESKGGARATQKREIPESHAPEAIRWTLSRDGLRRIYGTLLVHGRESAWARSAVRAGRALLARETYAGVISSGPPHGAHLGARRLARIAGAPLITDFRDPWSARRRLPEPYASPLYFSLADREQSAVLAASKLVIATTEPIADSLRDAGARCPVITVMNGNDDEQFHSPPRDRFIITYAGALYLDRDPRSLFSAVAELVRRTSATPNEIEVQLIGEVAHYAGRSTADLAADAGIGPYVRIERTMSRRALAERLAASSVLVSFPQDSKFAVPSKVFEYMAFEAWMLILAGPETPSAALMADTDAAIVSPGEGDVARMREVLADWFTAFRAGARPTFLSQRERFSRRTQAVILADALEALRAGGAR